MTDVMAQTKPSLPGVLFEVTSQCNLKCRYCYNVHKRPGGDAAVRGGFHTSIATLSRLFDMAAVHSVTMSGGEPLLAERFSAVVRFVLDAGKKVLITSNGNGGSIDQYVALAKMGVSEFIIPFHSILQMEHDSMTGVSGSQEHVLQTLVALAETGVTVSPLIVLTRENVTTLEKTMMFLGRIGFRRILVNRFNLGGTGIREAAQLAISPDSLRVAYDTANQTAQRCGLWVSSNVCTPHCILDPADYPRVGFGTCETDIRKRPITLDVTGNIRFCNHSPVVMGNIFSQSFNEIFITSYVQQWKTSIPAYCSNCSKWKACVGGCRAASEQMGQDMTHVDPIATLSA